jgi:predicted ATP-grasp superfamily ATP-dependent carboligase
MVTDKATMADHFRDHGIPTPRTKLIKHLLHPVSVDRDGPIVVKRRFGTGAESTRMIGDLQSLTIEELKRQKFILQPYLPGQPMSASFLVDVAGHLTLLAVGRQRIEIDPDGAISYQGGTILSEIDEAPAVVVEAVRSVIQTSDARFQGFVGVDYLDDPEIGINVLEINPRPTTSYVGLAYMFGPGMIAGAWLDSLKTFLGATDWPERFRALRQGFDVTFAADGTILSED